MSYIDFERGLIAEQVKERKRLEGEYDREQIMLKKWVESERVLNIFRSIKASHETLTKKELELWRKATKQRSLPVSL